MSLFLVLLTVAQPCMLYKTLSDPSVEFPVGLNFGQKHSRNRIRLSSSDQESNLGGTTLGRLQQLEYQTTDQDLAEIEPFY